MRNHTTRWFLIQLGMLEPDFQTADLSHYDIDAMNAIEGRSP